MEKCARTSEGIATIMQDKEDNRRCLGQCEELLSVGTVEQNKKNTCKAAQIYDENCRYIQISTLHSDNSLQDM